ncbi:MAG TPA: TIGR02921 family PEP-CTERM protein [Anaerolineae bacterium]|nr:TIGR02921 family PEP-CTERM protein [Anaerolineae bacterium]
MNEKIKKVGAVLPLIGGILFWIWNTVFISFMILGFAPVILPDLIMAVRTGFVPLNMFAYGATLATVPLLVSIVGYVWLRHHPERLFALGYGIEAPLMMLLALRFFAVREMGWGLRFLLGTAIIGVITFGWYLIATRPKDGQATAATPSPVIADVRFVGLTLLLVVGVYCLSWFSLYLPPFINGYLSFLREIPDMIPSWEQWQQLNWNELRYLPFAFSGFLLLFITGLLTMVLPLVSITLYGRAWWQTNRLVRQQRSNGLVWGVVLVVTIGWIVLLQVSNRQPQASAFTTLATEPTDKVAASALLDKEEQIKNGLLNAYLAPMRYASAEGESNLMHELYRNLATPETQARLQTGHDFFAQPLLYQTIDPTHASQERWGNQVFEAEAMEAADLYQQYFDEPIQQGEKESIVRAVGMTWDANRGREAVQAVDNREVFLSRQEVTVTEHGEWAEIELYEVYENQTMRQQEVVYYFSLPESAVLTGVWLGNSADRAERFEHRVAPRGAAQAVYESQVQVQQDPALLEQIGPRQYRLRVFPIEPMTVDWNEEWGFISDINNGPPLHLWVTMAVLAEDDAWPLPKLAERFNIYWTDKSERLINGQAVRLDEETWLPEAVEAKRVATFTNKQIDLGNGMTVWVAPPAGLATLPAETRLAVVLDRSYSMRDYTAEVEEALAALADWPVDLYLTSSAVHPEKASILPLTTDFAVNDILFFGGQKPGDLLQQFAELQGERAYDAVLILTDGAGYELGEAQGDIPTVDVPLWFVHLNDDLPLGYDDATLAVIQSSGGGSAGSVQEALTRLANQAADGSVQYVDGLLWRLMPTTGEVVENDAEFAPLAARFYILSEMVRQRQNLDQLEALDGLHALAVEHSIVTPYSSMIVLVTTAQERLLDQLEQGDDRFDREHDAVGETNSMPLNGVPEPHEWLLLIVSLGLGIWYWRRDEEIWAMGQG